MLDANAANVEAITANMAAVTAQMNASMQNLDGDGATSANARETAANIKSITDRFENIAQSMEKMTTDPKTQANIQTTLDNTARSRPRSIRSLAARRISKSKGKAGSYITRPRTKRVLL